jgi:CheY-like chemotaxis protein
VESTVGQGTRFLVLLPVAQKAPVTVRRSMKAQSTAHGGTETVLLVEDETAVREFGVAVLKSHGYRVLQASSGVEALEVWKWHGSRIVLLFSDLVLPDGLGGLELAATLRKEKPTLRVVLTSGYANETIEDGFQPPPGTHFIHKPYKPQVLAQTVRDALDGSSNR